MKKYIDADKLIAEIERFSATEYGDNTFGDDVANGALGYVLEEIIPSLQQEQPKDKQIITITESHGDANIEWDCRSLDDAIALLKSAESFITEKQIEKIASPGSRTDHATTEGRFSHLFKRQQEQPEYIEKTARISPGLLSNFGTSTYVLDVNLTQDEITKVAPIGFNPSKIKIKIVCE